MIVLGYYDHRTSTIREYRVWKNAPYIYLHVAAFWHYPIIGKNSVFTFGYLKHIFMLILRGVVSLFLLGICTSSAIKPRIIGGQEAAPHSMPYMVWLGYNGRTICGGTILSSRWILSAAHCFSRKQYNNWTIFTEPDQLFIGVHDTDDVVGKSYQVENRIMFMMGGIQKIFSITQTILLYFTWLQILILAQRVMGILLIFR